MWETLQFSHLDRDIQAQNCPERFQFEIHEKLKSSQVSNSYLAKESASGRWVVIKTAPLSAWKEGADQRLRQEAQALKQISRVDQAPQLMVSEGQDLMALITPYIPGISLQEYLQKGPLKVRELLHLGIGILTQLEKAHDLGILHCDLKPSNIIVSKNLCTAPVNLIDFGFSQPLTHPQSSRWGATAHYMAPEQAGVIKSEPDERADLYSLGVVLHVCATGENPFAAKTLTEVLEKISNVIPPKIVRPELPQALSEIIEHLLEKDPQARYQTATAALRDFRTLAEALERGESQPFIAVGTSDKRQSLAEPAFIGRREEMQNLTDWWNETLQGKGGIVFIEAESGGGKTRFLDEFSATQKNSFRIYRGQGVDQAAVRPFQLLSGIAERLSEEILSAPKERQSFSEKLGDHLQAVGNALPELGNALQITPVSLGPEDFGEIRNISALLMFLDALGSQNSPAVIILDDCQWADEQTIKLLREWQKRKDSHHASNYVLILVAFRSEEVKLSHPLRRVLTSRHLTLAPFADKEIQDFVESMAGKVPEAVTDWVRRLSAGSPFMASAVLRGFVESGLLLPSPKGWQLNEKDPHEFSSARSATRFLIKRLELLPATTLQFLSVAAIAGKQFSLAFCAKLSEQPIEQANQAVSEACRRQIIWQFENGDHCSFVHDKLREALLSRLPEAERKRLHFQAAQTLLLEKKDAVFEIAFHFDSAGESEKALPFALKAAEAARAQHSLAIALEQYRIAERGAKNADKEICRRITEGLGDLFLLRGEYAKAEAAFKKLFAFAQNEIEAAHIEGKLGEIAFKMGDVAKAAEAIENGLRKLGQKIPQSPVEYFWEVAKESGIQIIHTLFPRWFVGRRNPQTAPAQEFPKIRLFSRLAYINWFQKGKFPCLWAHLAEMNLAEKYWPTPELAQAYSEHSPVMTMVPWFSRGIDYAKRGLEIRRRNNDLWGQGQSLHFYGVALYNSGQFEECIEKCREAVRVMEKTGDRWEVNTANWHIAFCLYRLGEMRAAAEMAQQVYAEGMEIADHQAAGISLSVWSRATYGEVPAEMIRTERLRNTGDVHTRTEVLLAEGVRLLREKKYAQSVAIFREARETILRSGLHQEYVAPVYSWLVTALRLDLLAHRGVTNFPLKSQVGSLKKHLREALNMAHKYPNNLPHAYREAGYVAAMTGNYHRAKKLFNQSLQYASSQNAKHETLLTLKAKAKVGSELEWREADSDFDQISELTHSIYGRNLAGDARARQATLSLVDRFDSLLEVGKRLTHALTTEDVFKEVGPACKKLLRAEQCQILMVDESTQEISATSHPIASRGLIKRVLQTGRVAAQVADLEGNLDESMELSHLKSALACPIFIRGKIVAVFCAHHHRLGAFFGEEEKKLAEFISALAGSALENASSYAEMKALSDARKKDIQELRMAKKELSQRAEELKRSNSDLEKFAYIVSHDLKQPLRAINNFLHLLESRNRSQLDQESKSYIDYAVNGGRRLYQLIEDLLAYSKIGFKEVPKCEISLQKCLETAKSNLQLVIAQTQTDIQCGELPTLHGNETQLTMLFQNLIDNAIKFRGTSRPVVKILATQDKENWLFSVQDNGIGIEPEYFETIFKIFERLHGAEEYPGTGIGLAVCKRITELHDGKIWIDSTPGQGTTFWFTLSAKVPVVFQA